MDRNLLDINNDCFLEIFEYFTVEELADVASTCTRFRTIARDVFSHRYKLNCVDIDLYDDELNASGQTVPRIRRQPVAIIRNFGDLLTKLKVNLLRYHEESLNTFFYNMMVKYCTGAFQRLEINHLRAHRPDENIDAAALFRNVKELALDDSSAVDNTFLSDAKQLTRFNLSLIDRDVTVKILSNDYPELQAISLVRLPGREIIDIVAFLKRHPNVVELNLSNSHRYDLSSIAECPGLRQLSVWDCEADQMSAVAELDKLTALKCSNSLGGRASIEILNRTKSYQSLVEIGFWGNGRHDDREDPTGDEPINNLELRAVLGRFSNLTHFSAIYFDDYNDEFLAVLHSSKKLRVVSISAERVAVTSDGLVNLVRQLSDLEELSLYPSLHFNAERLDLLESTYLKICD